MEAHLAPKSSAQVNKIASSCEICSGLHDAQYCMENPKQAFVDYASSRSNEVGGKQFTTNQGPRNFNEATNAWKKRLSSLGTQLRQQQDDVINKINTLCKVISKRKEDIPEEEENIDPNAAKGDDHNITVGTKEEVKEESKESDEETEEEEEDDPENIKTNPPSSDKEEEEKANPKNINTTPPSPLDPSFSFITEKVRKLNLFLESSGVVPQSSYTKFVCIREDDLGW
ncbi:hypothetical protein Tco_0528865 [Tanacetum coccineum]